MSTEPERSPARYRFGPSDSLGIIGGVRISQALVLGAGVGAAMATLYALPARVAPVALVPLAVAALVAFVPLRGMLALDWLRLATLHGTDRLRGATRWHSPTPTVGVPGDEEEGPLSLPRSWGDLHLVSVPHAGRSVGVLVDRRRATATATLLVRVESFGLLSDADQEGRVGAWGMVLAALARETNAIRRISWVERTVPAEADEIAAYFAAERSRDADAHSSSVRSYVDLIDADVAAALEHECFVSVQIDTSKRRREIRQRAGTGTSFELASGIVAVDELRLVAQGLDDAGIGSVGALPPRLLAAAIRYGIDPDARAHLARLHAAGREEGCAPDAAGPIVVDERWDAVCTDGAWHATFWIQSWPSRDVGCLFLHELLVRTIAERTVSVTAEPIPPSRAAREAERAVVREEGDQVTRERHGFLQTARHRRRQDDITSRESELADGHSLLRFAGHVTVTAATRQELEAACAEVVQAAQHSHLELRRLYGEQASALAATIPGLASGLR